MSTLADVFRELNTLKTDDLVRDYAIGGATAVLFYAEPARTYVIIPCADSSSRMLLSA